MTDCNEASHTRIGEMVVGLRKSLAVALLTAVALGGSARAQSISWLDEDTHITTETNWYRPRMAADFAGDVVVMGLDEGTSLGPTDYWAGFNLLNETSLDGSGEGDEFTGGDSRHRSGWFSSL